jgi:glutaredoxin
MTIKLITLETCNRCKKLKELLSKNNIIFSEITCEENPTECDKLEMITNASMYPMIIVSSNKTTNTNIIFEPDSYKELKPPYHYRDEIWLNPVNSVDIMSEIVKKLVY